jgi:hypothetical protein
MGKNPFHLSPKYDKLSDWSEQIGGYKYFTNAVGYVVLKFRRMVSRQALALGVIDRQGRAAGG